MVQERNAQEIIIQKRTAKKSTTPSQATQSLNAGRNDYGTAVAISSIISFLGWVAVLIGAIAVIAAFGSFRYGGILALLPALGIIVAGLFLVVSGQITRATVDNANYSREILYLLRSLNNPSEEEIDEFKKE